MEREIEMAQNIIDDPKRSSANRKIAERALIVAGTGAVLYFFVMVTFALWYFAGLYFIENIFSWNHVEATVRVLLQLLVAALASAVVLLSWSEYNFRRYAHLNRVANLIRSAPRRLPPILACRWNTFLRRVRVNS